MRRVWIEIQRTVNLYRSTIRHPPCGGCGLKCKMDGKNPRVKESPSMRRVWIEIFHCKPRRKRSRSHPPCGGCGLKYAPCNFPAWWAPRSPSMRRVWIEIAQAVTSLAGSVGHPPCGGCGLKSDLSRHIMQRTGHPPCGGCGLKWAYRTSVERPPTVTLHAEGVD